MKKAKKVLAIIFTISILLGMVVLPTDAFTVSTLAMPEGFVAIDDFNGENTLDWAYGNREFWCRGYYVDTVGKKKKAIAEYIRNQLQEDLAYEQMSIKELVDPFTGELVKASKK